METDNSLFTYSIVLPICTKEGGVGKQRGNAHLFLCVCGWLVVVGGKRATATVERNGGGET